MAFEYQSPEYYGLNKYSNTEFGSFGEVYITKHYAIKKEEYINGSISESAFRDIVYLSHVYSKFVMNVVDIYLDNDSSYIILPKGEGDLNGIILDNREIPRMIKDTAIGLADIHNSDILNLDVKPKNIIKFPDSYKFTDLGISLFHTCAFKSLEPINGVTFYTIDYRPPEVILGSRVSDKSDVFALGISWLNIIISSRIGEKFSYFKPHSEYDLLRTYFELFGTPTNESWPGFNKIISRSEFDIDSLRFEGKSPEYIKILFHDTYHLTEEEIDIIIPMLHMNPKARPSIFKVLHNIGIDYKRVSCKQKIRNYIVNNSDVWTIPTFDQYQYLILWMIQVTRYGEYETYILSMAIDILNKVKRKINIHISKFQLCGAASIYIAGMFSFYIGPNIDDLEYLGDKAFTSIELSDMVNYILKLLDFRVGNTNAYIMLSRENISYKDTHNMDNIWELSSLTKYSFIDQAKLYNIINNILHDNIGRKELNLLKEIHSLYSNKNVNRWEDEKDNVRGTFHSIHNTIRDMIYRYERKQ
jgi:serine/threonine protein kinase